MVRIPPAKDDVTPAGKFVTVAPVALPPIVYVILVMAVLIQTVWLVVAAAEVSTSVGKASIVIVPVKDASVHTLPVVVTV